MNTSQYKDKMYEMLQDSYNTKRIEMLQEELTNQLALQLDTQIVLRATSKTL